MVKCRQIRNTQSHVTPCMVDFNLHICRLKWIDFSQERITFIFIGKIIAKNTHKRACVYSICDCRWIFHKRWAAIAFAILTDKRYKLTITSAWYVCIWNGCLSFVTHVTVIHRHCGISHCDSAHLDNLNISPICNDVALCAIVKCDNCAICLCRIVDVKRARSAKRCTR